jgi:hypothetical protein
MNKARVIARRIAPKQPRGTSAQVRGNQLGCFAVLAMTREKTSPPSALRATSPSGENNLNQPCDVFHSGLIFSLMD